jgi:hypothetical protein
MLTAFDDYLVHQTAEPIASPATGDRNFYDRHFFNGFTRDGDLYFGVALGLYPNRHVMDAAFTLVRDGRQQSVRASRLAPTERGETRVGPIAVEVVEPLRTLRVRVAPNDFGLEADLLFRARGTPIEEPRFTWRVDNRLLMDTTRLTQFGLWEGTITAGGRPLRIEPTRVPGVRDRSWGVRPIGEPEGGAPSLPPQFFWLWSPVHFDDVCTHFDANEDAEGRRWHAAGMRLDLGSGVVEPMARVEHRVRWRPGTRRSDGAEITLVPYGGEPLVVRLEPLLTAQMLGLGYLHPEWGHGMWKGELAVAGDSWSLGDLDPLDPRHLHVQQVCRARMGAREGVGILEQIVLGPHGPSGFRSILDGWTAP